MSKNEMIVIEEARTGPDPIKKFQQKILLYASIGPITELINGHMTDAMGGIPP